MHNGNDLYKAIPDPIDHAVREAVNEVSLDATVFI